MEGKNQPHKLSSETSDARAHIQYKKFFLKDGYICMTEKYSLQSIKKT